MSKFENSWFDGTANLFRANAALNKLMALDVRTEFEAKNEVTNGDFSNGTTGWEFDAGTAYTVANNELKFTPNARFSGAMSQSIGATVSGSKYYVSMDVKTLDTYFQIYLLSFYGPNNNVAIGAPTINGSYTHFSTIVTSVVSSGASWIKPQSTATSGFVEISVKNVSIIDLTAAFGAGKEPTLAEMDRLMARFPNSWFDGVKPIQTIETLYQEKANKTQEAWITPTLVNGATGTIQYMRDDLGFVHFKGSLTAPVGAVETCLTLPIGYRPLASSYHAGQHSETDATSIVMAWTNGYFYVGTSTASETVMVDGFTFRAEV